MDYMIRSLRREEALIISEWKYPEPYTMYSLGGHDDLEELLDGSYHSVINRRGHIIGFFCFGTSAQVPTGSDYGAYNQKEFLDIGLGMNPVLCGQGRGYEFFLTGLDYAREKFGNQRFRLTVATFNKRALTIYERVGFRRGITFVKGVGDYRLEFVTMSL